MEGQTQTSTTPAQHPGMGAIPYEGGVTFRVWAPHADEVRVAGEFNDWSRDNCPLAAEDNGCWSADVPQAEPGQEYKFLIVNGDETFLKNDPYARDLVHSSGNSIIYDPHFDWEGDDFQLPPWNELVLYELHVGTFTTNDDGEAGTLRSCIERLDYLKDLGINAIEMMPLAEFAGDYSWGYNTAYPFAVESAYGGPQALKMLVREAHARGIAVFMDVVYNHFGPSDLDLWQFDGWSEDDRGGIYFYNDHRAETPWGETRPDYGRPEVRRYIQDNVLMWLDEFRLDGLRWDGTIFIRSNGFSEEAEPIPDGWRLMQEINGAVHERLSHKLSIAEDLQRNAALVRRPEDDGAGFDVQWDAGFVHPIRRAIIPTADEERDMEAVRDALLHRYTDDAFQRIIYTESHDEVANGRARVVEEIEGYPQDWAPQKRSTLGAALVMTAPGIPMLFQGQEFLEDEWFRVHDQLDWDNLKKSNICQLYRDLIALRRNLRGTTRGLTGQHADCYHLNHEAKMLALHRWEEGGPGDDTVVVANLSGDDFESYHLGFPGEGRWQLRLNSDWNGYSDNFGNYPSFDVDAAPDPRDDQPASAEVAIGPYSVLIYSQNPS